MAAMLLGDMGADVVKVESPRGDRSGSDPGYLTWNRNKRLLKLDLDTYEGRGEARRLVAATDIALFDARPGQLERAGFDGPTLTGQHPRLVHAWLPPYGPRGRWSQLPPDETLLSAVSGIAFQQMSFEDVPVYLVTPQIGYAHAAMAATAIAAAVYEREKSGRGQAVEISGLHAVASIQSGGHLKADGITRIGGRSSRGGSPNYRLYQCADGEWFFLGCLTPAFFLQALEASDLLDLLASEGVNGEIDRLMGAAADAEGQEAIENRFGERPREEWLSILKSNGVPCAPVGTREEWFNGPTIRANGMRRTLPHPDLGEVTMPGIPLRLSDTPGQLRAHIENTTPEAVGWDLGGRARPSEGTARDVAGPLDGIRILDMGVVIAGTYGPSILANLGADVIKVEPLEGDFFRPHGLGFIGFNQGKRAIAIDLKKPDGLEAFLQLVRASDAVVDNFRKGVRERLGIHYEALREANPRIISCSVTGYGLEGPLESEPGFDPLVQAQGGLMEAQGGDDEPVFYQIPVNDTATGLMTAFGILSAIVAREQTGQGQDIQTSLASQSVLFQSGELTNYAGRPPALRGGRDYIGPRALRRFYACKDGWIAIAANQPRHFHAVAMALDHPEWAGRFIAERAVAEQSPGALASLLEDTFAELPRDEAVERLLARSVPVAPALRAVEMFEEPWSQANDHLWEFDHPQFGRISAVRGFAGFSRTPGGWPRRAPLLGEHSREVLLEAGVPNHRVGALIAAGTVLQG